MSLLSTVGTFLGRGDFGLIPANPITALEGVTEVFSRELDPAWNIKVSPQLA